MSKKETGRGISRRALLKGGGALVLSALADTIGIHIARTEVLPPCGISLPTNSLIPLAQARLGSIPEPAYFGPHALENHTPRSDQVWQKMETVKHALGREDTVGIFAEIGNFSNSRAINYIEFLMLEINRRGSIPMLNISVGGMEEGTHPLDQKHWVLIEHQLKHLFTVLDELKIPHYVRLNFEFNGNWFWFGRGRQLSNPVHEKSIRWLFSTASRMISSFDPMGKLIFSPNTGDEIINYVPLRENALDPGRDRGEIQYVEDVIAVAEEQDREGIRTHLGQQQARYLDHLDRMQSAGEESIKMEDDNIIAAGIDGYVWFPGRGQFLRAAYWIPTYNLTPETIYLKSFIDLQVGFPDLPKIVTEAGTLSMDPEVLLHTFAMLLALGASGFMPFIVNRDPETLAEHLDPIFRNWMPTADSLGLIAQLVSTAK